MFRLLSVILLAGAAFAQTTTVTGTITDAAGDRLTGTCSVTPVEPFTAAAGWRVAGTPVVFAFSNGSFSAALAPTDSASPTGQYYQVECAAPQQTINGNVVGPASWGPRYWLVPTSTTPLDMNRSIGVTSVCGQFVSLPKARRCFETSAMRASQSVLRCGSSASDLTVRMPTIVSPSAPDLPLSAAATRA